MKIFEGKLVSKSIKVGIVAARFNEFITSKLLSGAMDGLLRHDVQEEDIHVAWVPGAFEIPLIVISAKLLYAYTCRRVAPAGILLEWDGSEAKVCAMPRYIIPIEDLILCCLKPMLTTIPSALTKIARRF